jgi:hypothetical protein
MAFDNALEVEPNDAQAQASKAPSDPLALNGIIEKAGDVDWFLKSLTYIKEGSIPHQYSTEVKDGCPDDYETLQRAWVTTESPPDLTR